MIPRCVYLNGACWLVYRECPGAPLFVLHRQGYPKLGRRR